jgi:phosphate transport system permease protein
MPDAAAPASVTRPAPPPPVAARAWGDRLFRVLCQGAALLVIVLAVSLVATLFVESWPFFAARGLELLYRVPWDPGSTEPVYGGLALIYGTLVTSAIAMLLAVPLGVGTAAFLAEVAPGWLRRTGSFLVELLAAIPSVVYGLWGLQVLAPRVGGPGLLAAGVVLAVMVVPYVTAIGYDVCRAVPRSQREGALALGATRWQMIRTAVLPYARPGIVAACFLALGRALGETMAVTMLIGNKALAVEPPVGGVGDSIASVIANQLNEATREVTRSGLIALGLLLLLVTVGVNVLARLLIRRVGQPRPRPARTVHLTSAPAADGPPAAPPPPLPAGGNPRAALLDRAMTGVLGAALLVTLAPLFLILGLILLRGLPGLSWAFFTELPAPPGRPGGGLAHALAGSAILVGLATAGAVPLGVLAAVFLAEYRTSRLAAPVRFVGEILGGVPSIIVGIFAYSVCVLSAGGDAPSFSAWAGSFALGVMMIPIVLRTTEEALRLVPQSLRDASYALGAAHWQTVLRVAVPAALPAITTGVFLAVARIAGETAPLLLTAYGSQFFPESLNEPTPFLPRYIYTYASSGFPTQVRQAWAAALVLVGVVMLLNVGIRLVTGQRVVSATRAD